MVRLAKEYKCMVCGMEIDETEYSDPKDADICGYCFCDKVNEIKSRKLTFAPASNECGIHRETAFMADVEIRLERAKNENDRKAVEIYERMLRLLRA
jgi:hypothetical protein